MRRHAVLQHDAHDCGAACLLSVASFHGMSLSLAEVRKLTATGRFGTSLKGLQAGAMALGFDAKGIRASPESLMALPKPAILHLATGNKSFHFVVLFRYRKRYLQIMDPADGAFHRVSHDDFEAKWTGAALILMPGLPSG